METRQEYFKEYRLKNRECLIAHDKEYRSSLEYKKRKAKYMRDYYRVNLPKVRNEIFQLLGNKCSNPFNIEHGSFLIDSRCFQIDHVNGNGHEQRRKSHNTYTYHKRILEEIKNGSKDYQLLCANCNWIKRLLNREYSQREA